MKIQLFPKRSPPPSSSQEAATHPPKRSQSTGPVSLFVLLETLRKLTSNNQTEKGSDIMHEKGPQVKNLKMINPQLEPIQSQQEQL